MDPHPPEPAPGPAVSFEFFPPKTEAMAEQLWAAIAQLAPLRPRFVSVTYGAGGSTRERTHATVARIQAETGLAAAAHLTCIQATRTEIEAVAAAYWQAGIRHVVALRGDPPEGPGRYAPHPGGFAYASDLVAGLARVAPFEISVACYPERHPESPDEAADLDHLKRKVDAGATRAITQFFFDNAAFLRFRDRAAAAGIGVPIVPGILPVTNFQRTQEFAGRCGAAIPAHVARAFDGLDADPQTRQLVAAGLASEQCAALAAEGVREFHFYTLNRAELTLALCRRHGNRAAEPAAVA